MDVRSAAMVFIAVHIQHESRHFGLIGKTLRLPGILSNLEGDISKTMLKGDEDCQSASDLLQAAIAEFNSTFSKYGHTRTFNEVKGIHSKIAQEFTRV
jgi:hypothetical protein